MSASGTIQRAANILRAGGLVAFPTETVYGLGADAVNPAAVARIYSAKGRPSTNPLIAHVASEAVARKYAQTWPEAASQLARRFWPGPLTLVLAKRLFSGQITSEVTAGRATVGLRVPDHPLALALLSEFGGPVAAPSANRSTRVSPTTAQHVRDELGDSVDMVLDGGPCRVGIESTVLDLTTVSPTILRPGGVSQQQIEWVIGPVAHFSGSADPSVAAASPGQHAIHYAPRTPAYRFETADREIALNRFVGGKRVALLVFDGVSSHPGMTMFEMPTSPEPYAAMLYQTLRDCDRGNFDVIAVEMPPDELEWVAVRDRLTRATRSIDPVDR